MNKPIIYLGSVIAIIAGTVLQLLNVHINAYYAASLVLLCIGLSVKE